MTRAVEQRCGGVSADADHIVPIGRMIEEMEAKLRSSLDDVYFKKTREVRGKGRGLH